MGKITVKQGEQRKLIAVLGETKTGVYFEALNPDAQCRSIYLSYTGKAQTSIMTLEALSKTAGVTPIYEGETITFEF